MEKKINTFRPIINTYYNACLMFKFCTGFIFCGHISCTSAKKKKIDLKITPGTFTTPPKLYPIQNWSNNCI